MGQDHLDDDDEAGAQNHRREHAEPKAERTLVGAWRRRGGGAQRLVEHRVVSRAAVAVADEAERRVGEHAQDRERHAKVHGHADGREVDGLVGVRGVVALGVVVDRAVRGELGEGGGPRGEPAEEGARHEDPVHERHADEDLHRRLERDDRRAVRPAARPPAEAGEAGARDARREHGGQVGDAAAPERLHGAPRVPRQAARAEQRHGEQRRDEVVGHAEPAEGDEEEVAEAAEQRAGAALLGDRAVEGADERGVRLRERPLVLVGHDERLPHARAEEEAEEAGDERPREDLPVGERRVEEEHEREHAARQAQRARERAGDRHRHHEAVLLGRERARVEQRAARQQLGRLAYRIGDEDDPVLRKPTSVAEGKEHVDSAVDARE